MQKILQVVKEFFAERGLETDCPCALYLPRPSPMFEKVSLFGAGNTRPSHSLDAATLIPCQYLGSSATQFTEAPGTALDYRRAVIICTTKYAEASPEHKNEFLPKVSHLVAMNYQGHMITNALMEPNRGDSKATKANFLAQVPPASTFTSSAAGVMIARLLGMGYWLVAWQLPLELAASGIAVPRPQCFELSRSNFIRKLVKLEPTTDCDPIPLPYVMDKLTEGRVELRVQQGFGACNRLLERDGFNVAQLWSLVGPSEVEQRAKKQFKLAYSTWYMGNGPCHEGRLLVDNQGQMHNQYQLTPEVDLGLPPYTDTWAKPIKPYDLCI